MKKRKDVFVVGYMGDSQVVYGSEDFAHTYTMPMGEEEAKKMCKQMPSKGARVYKLTLHGRTTSKGDE